MPFQFRLSLNHESAISTNHLDSRLTSSDFDQDVIGETAHTAF
jgi:hypothetical protein